MCIRVLRKKLGYWMSHKQSTVDGVKDHSAMNDQTDTNHHQANTSHFQQEDMISRAQDTFQQHLQQPEALTAYVQNRDELLAAERTAAWDGSARSSASSAEIEAGRILHKIREYERNDASLYGNIAGEAVPHAGTRDMGGRFLVNRERIEKTRVFSIAKEMPKGAHLHLHFNTALPPARLLIYARDVSVQKHMFIRSNRPLVTSSDFSHVETEIVLSVLPHDEKTARGNIFSPQYDPDWTSRPPRSDCWMNLLEFRRQFPPHLPLQDDDAEDRQHEHALGLDLAERWICEKMIITTDRAYGHGQTTNGAWACFNQGTRALKGLTNYESAYRRYIGDAIDGMMADKVMYAEIRDMLFNKTIVSDDGLRQLGHFEQMRMVCEEVEKKTQSLIHPEAFPFGLKIIYSTPRSIPRDAMMVELENCLALKLAYPSLICGFDLVGAEDRKNHIGHYADLLVAFSQTCRELSISIPFIFHAGESLLDAGGTNNPDNSNLYDALLLGAKRVGHGVAILKHPTLVEAFKKERICLELCPVSNELLGLCGNIREHAFTALLNQGLPCTLNADNPSSMRGRTLTTSSLSHEFYQVFVGDPRMSIHGWKQLALWSLKFACLNTEERERAVRIFQRDWERFCEGVVEEYADFAEGLREIDPPTPSHSTNSF